MSFSKAVLVLLVALLACAGAGFPSNSPAPVRGLSIDLAQQGDTLRGIIGWTYPPVDAAGPVDSVVIGWTYGTQPFQVRGKRPPAVQDTAYFRAPGVCEWATGAVSLVSWRRSMPSTAVVREFEFGVDCPAPAPPGNVRWVDSVRRVP